MTQHDTALAHNPEAKTDVATRLKRIEGQVRGLQRMVDEDLRKMSRRFDAAYAGEGRLWLAPFGGESTRISARFESPNDAVDLVSGAETRWEVVPQMQVTLNTRQHVMLNAGVRLPLEGGDAQVVIYLLWDWFDGGFFEGW